VISLSERFAWQRYASDAPDQAVRLTLIRELRAFRVRGPARP
jgi:hypothetical protein